MKSKLLLFVLIMSALISGTALFAQEWTSYSPEFQEGDLAVQAGIGLIPLGGYYGDVSIPPVSVSVDYALPVADLPLSFGGFIGYTASKDEYSYGSYDWAYKYTYFLLGARASYHVDFNVDNLDTYGGLLLGYNVVTVSTEGDDSFATNSASGSSLILGGFVGCRYFFTENLAAYGELGYGISLINLGVTYKF